MSTVLTLFLFIYSSAFSAGAKKPMEPKNIYDISVNDIKGNATTLQSYKGKTLLIVNTASECGYTPQYKGLQELQNHYSAKGFTVLGFPSNDFGAQEPGSAEEIQQFCERKYKVTFPLFEKNPVSGNRIQPLYAYLIKNGPSQSAVEWNFTKFLVNKEGKIVGRYKSGVAPESEELKKAIEAQL